MAAEQTSELDSGGLKVFEARFGDKNGALVLLEFPAEMREFFLRLSDKADLPDSAPAGAVWEPFVRGWQQDDYYLIALTEADQKAIRPGMITTRMFAIPLSQAQRWDALEVLFEILREANRYYVPEQSIHLKQDHSPSTVPTALLTCVAHRLIHENKPAVIIGQCGFEDLVAALWKKIPPELRVNFGFSFSFTPADLSVSRANIVAVPASCEARWSGYKLKCDAKWEQPLNDSTAAFLSDAQACGFLEFLRNVDLVFHSFSDYGRYARLWNYWQRRAENDPEVSYALLRSLGTLLPRPEQAVKHKAEAMQIAAAMLKNATPDGILAQRSVKADSFPAGAHELERAICEWLKSRFESDSTVEVAGLCDVISALPSCQSTAWQGWIRNGLKQAFTPLAEKTAQTIWSIWNKKETLAEIGAQLPTDAQTEEALLQTVPNVFSAKLYSVLVKWSVGRGWISLMAKSSLTHLGFAQALELVLEQNEGRPRIAAIELLCANAKPPEVWASVFEHDEAILRKCAIVAARTEPSLWNCEAPDLRRWTDLLEAATQAEPGLLRKINSNAVVKRLFEAWEKGVSVEEGICNALEKAERLEFTGCANRSRLWTKLPKHFLAKALANTLRAWLKDYYSRPPTKPILEKELADILFETCHIEFTFPRNSPTLGLGGVMLLETWGAEADCILWLNAVIAGSVELANDVAKRSGELVAKRQWGSVARAAKDNEERRGRHDLGPVWQTYFEKLGKFEKFIFNIIQTLSPSAIGTHAPMQTSSVTDAIFVTALAEEFTAVRAHLSDRKEYTEQGTIYEIGLFRTEEAECRVAVVQTGMGNALSAAATERVLNLFKPTFAFFVGIAGGLRDDLKIGDVVAADKVYGYESGKSGAHFHPRPEATSVSHEACQRANAVMRDDLWQKRIVPTPPNMPAAIVKPIAAGDKVLTSEASEDLKRIRTTYTDAHAVAMEDHGFAIAVKAHPSVCFAVVRGVSDLIENKQVADRAGCHEIAARNAAAFAFEMLAGLLRGRASLTR